MAANGRSQVLFLNPRRDICELNHNQLAKRRTLIFAVYGGSTKTVSLLIASGADVNSKDAVTGNDGGREYGVFLCLCCIVVFLIGPGKYALSNLWTIDNKATASNAGR